MNTRLPPEPMGARAAHRIAEAWAGAGRQYPSPALPDVPGGPRPRCACGGGCPRCAASRGGLRVGRREDPREEEAENLAARVASGASVANEVIAARAGDEPPVTPAPPDPIQQPPTPGGEAGEGQGGQASQGGGQAAPTCDPKGLARDKFLQEPGTSMKDFGLTTLDTSLVTYPEVKTQTKGSGVELLATTAALPGIPSVYTAAGSFIEGEAHFVGQNGPYDCPSKKYPLRWTITPGGATKIHDGEAEHCADFQWAFDHSLKPFAEAVNALAGKVYGDQARAEKAVGKKAGAAPADWPGIFRCLARKTLTRDSSGWHTPRADTRGPTLDSGCAHATARVSDSSLLQVGRHPAADIIKDCGEPGSASPSATQGRISGPGAGSLLRRQAAPGPGRVDGQAAPASVYRALASPGTALDRSTRAFMEAGFGRDFSRVRIHADGGAATSAREVEALAYSVGGDVVFGPGQYQPGTAAGRRLIAHELVHVAQEDAAGGILRRQPAPAGRLRAARFQGDPILEQVMDNLIHLKNGSRGPRINIAVQKVQRALIDAGFPLPEYGPDGLFGSETERTVKAFQADRDLPPEQQDGIVGPITLGRLDDHFATGESPSTPPPPDPALAGIGFELAEDSGRPRYSGPEGPAEDLGESIRLDGPTYSFLAKVTASGGDAASLRRWDVGHIQDLTAYAPTATYADGHSLAFECAFPIRDSARGEQRYPFYRPGDMIPASPDAPVTSVIMDTPGATFPKTHQGQDLTRIDLSFKAVDWVVARQRHTGELRFIHQAGWGFTHSLVMADWPNHTEPLMVEPDRDEIVEKPGMGETAPSMTEAVYNDTARLVEKSA